ncbi:protein kinase domain-containing protein [Streptomyces sp. NPDC002845]
MADEGRLVAGRYRLAEQIGRGGMGTVWQAEDEVLDRQVALKRLHARPHLADDERDTLYERTRREARSAARITHPNVVVVHDVVEDEGTPCIVMEYVPSTTLDDLLKGGGTLPPEEAARIGIGMIAALRAAHAAGVLHRDVKPGNVLLGAGGRVVLTDFGIATATGTSTLTRTGEIVGSIDYIAPERIRGLTPGPASDLWALGATLYQAVEGRAPFRRDTAVETAYAIAVDPLEPMKQAGALEPLIETLLSKDPDERPSAEGVERALRTVGTLEPLGAAGTSGAAETSGTSESYVCTSRLSAPPSAREPHPGPRPPGDRPRRKGRARVWGAAAAVLAVVAAAGAGLYATSADHGGATDGTAGKPATTAPAYAPSPVPDGHHLATAEKLGVAFPVPDGWKLSKSTLNQVTYIDPSGLVELSVGMVDPAGDPLAHFKDIETNTKLNYSAYRKLYLQRTTFQGQRAAVWEFTFEGRVRTFHAINLGFGEEGGREYDIYVSAPDEQWDTYRPVFDTVRGGFRTTGQQ